MLWSYNLFPPPKRVAGLLFEPFHEAPLNSESAPRSRRYGLDVIGFSFPLQTQTCKPESFLSPEVEKDSASFIAPEINITYTSGFFVFFLSDLAAVTELILLSFLRCADFKPEARKTRRLPPHTKVVPLGFSLFQYWRRFGSFRYRRAIAGRTGWSVLNFSFNLPPFFEEMKMREIRFHLQYIQTGD